MNSSRREGPLRPPPPKGWAAPPDPGAKTPFDPRDVSACVVCGGTAVAKKCKIVCQNCGYTRDCSDP